MFGLTDSEMENYRNNVLEFAMRDITPSIISDSRFIIPAAMHEGQLIADGAHMAHLKLDLEKIITMVTMDAAYEYADLQCEGELSEAEMIEKIHNHHSSLLVTRFIQYAVSFTTEVIDTIMGFIIPELPYLYSYAIEDDNFDEDLFLDERLDAYESYVLDMESEDGDEEHDD
jgi:hypothetical protein